MFVESTTTNSDQQMQSSSAYDISGMFKLQIYYCCLSNAVPAFEYESYIPPISIDSSDCFNFNATLVRSVCTAFIVYLILCCR